jgi:hypothetical protein
MAKVWFLIVARILFLSNHFRSKRTTGGMPINMNPTNHYGSYLWNHNNWVDLKAMNEWMNWKQFVETMRFHYKLFHWTLPITWYILNIHSVRWSGYIRIIRDLVAVVTMIFYEILNYYCKDIISSQHNRLVLDSILVTVAKNKNK